MGIIQYFLVFGQQNKIVHPGCGDNDPNLPLTKMIVSIIMTIIDACLPFFLL